MWEMLEEGRVWVEENDREKEKLVGRGYRSPCVEKKGVREREACEKGVEKSMCRGKGVGEREVGGERVGSCMVGDEGQLIVGEGV